MKTKEVGERAERVAEHYLRQKSYEILCRNYRTKFGEIDLITQEGQSLVFVEVRSRKENAWQSALESVDFRKQSKIIRTARHFLMPFTDKDYQEIRFDVVAVQDGNVIEHIQGAW
jgi:putative endonuclease